MGQVLTVQLVSANRHLQGPTVHFANYDKGFPLPAAQSNQCISMLTLNAAVAFASQVEGSDSRGSRKNDARLECH